MRIIESIYNKLKYLLYLCMFVISIYWGVTSASRFADKSLIVISMMIIIICGYLYSYRFRKLIHIIIEHRIYIYILVIVFQLFLLVSTNLMIRSDAAFIYNCVINDDGEILGYLNVNSNNVALFIYERIFVILFSAKYAIWVMQFLNILYLNIAIYILDKTIIIYFSKSISNITFLFYLLLLGFTPQFLAMYTDIMILPIISLQIFFAMKFFDSVDTKNIIFFSILSSIGVLIRPTCFVLVIAFALIFILQINYKLSFKVINLLLCFVLIFALSSGGKYILEKTAGINPVVGEEKTMLSFVDLGLTSTGTDQVDFREGLALFIKDEPGWETFSTNVVICDIKRRLNNYGAYGLLEHVLYKEALTTSDGTLGWVYKDESKEVDYFINPLYDKLKLYKAFDFIRGYFIYTDDSRFVFYSTWLQIFFVLMIMGCIFAFFNKNNNASNFKLDFLTLACFGGLLFLMIFEGGKSRYLIQFLPLFLIVSGCGWEKIIKYINNNRE